MNHKAVTSLRCEACRQSHANPPALFEVVQAVDGPHAFRLARLTPLDSAKARAAIRGNSMARAIEYPMLDVPELRKFMRTKRPCKLLLMGPPSEVVTSKCRTCGRRPQLTLEELYAVAAAAAARGDAEAFV